MSYRQPWLQDLVTVLRAPTVVLSASDGQITAGSGHGVLHADFRVLAHAELRLDGEAPTGIAGTFDGADRAHFTAVARNLGDPTPDPTVRVDRFREVTATGVSERIRITSTAAEPVRCEVSLDVAADHARPEQIKYGVSSESQAPELAADDTGCSLTWTHPMVSSTLRALGATAEPADEPGRVRLRWPVAVEPGHPHDLHWQLDLAVESGLFGGATTPDPWGDVDVSADDRRLAPLVRQSLADLAALRMAPLQRPADEFLAAGSPWYFTLFGRDSIWAARLMLPFGTELAAGTLRTLAALQGSAVDEATAEEPGKIPHEQRAVPAVHAGQSRASRGMTIPPLYYGTVDATPLWICLLHDAWRWGLASEEVRALIPALRAALAWLRDFGDADGDGFLEYLDTSGTGLANQGWKDSGDSIRFADGSIADGPVALCEVQGYAYEAAVHGADLLDAFGEAGADEWRQWAAALRDRFRDRFWVSGRTGRFPALALDGDKRAVDSLASNIGHLLGTGILDAEETAQVAELLVSPEMSSGFGLRTMSSADGGYWPLSYHCGSVWPHDTAIAVRGLAADGHLREAFVLIAGLLDAGAGFDYRIPELLSGDASDEISWPVPYPPSCRPQAWSAAAAGTIVATLLGLRVDVPGNSLVAGHNERSPFGEIRATGIRVAGNPVELTVDRDGQASVVPG